MAANTVSIDVTLNHAGCFKSVFGDLPEGTVRPAEDGSNARAQFDNWNSKRGMTGDDAKSAYVTLITRLMRNGTRFVTNCDF
uniref:ACB domain-containing protein n=1 Tax=Daphnia galeata TaxID=27404 RepID=A0A8J2RXY1_9CRUS|nr:unnamed protein product [Daphnia galeata]